MRNFAAMEDQRGASIGGRRPVYLAFASSDHTRNGVAPATATSNYKMEATDHVIIATSAESDGVAIITLPSMAEACGKFYSIYAPTGATAGDISVYVRETGAELTTYGDLDADGDTLVAFCTGQTWVPIASVLG